MYLCWFVVCLQLLILPLFFSFQTLNRKCPEPQNQFSLLITIVIVSANAVFWLLCWKLISDVFCSPALLPRGAVSGFRLSLLKTDFWISFSMSK